MMEKSACQVHDLALMSRPMGAGERLWQRRNRLVRIAQRRWRYLKRTLAEVFRI